MKYPLKYLIPAYYTTLNGVVNITGIGVLPVYDGEVPPTWTGSYILIGDRTSVQMQGKGTYNNECTVLVDVCIKGASMGYALSQDGANQVTALINSAANPAIGPSFQCVTTSVQSTNTITGINKTDNIFRTLIRFRHIIKQIS
jgi:hypothetical protein